jgi:hypothetical protein
VWLSVRKCLSDYERVGRLPSEVKVKMCLDMTEACVQVCAAGIRAANPGISDAEVIRKIRERFEWGKRWQRKRRG